MIKKKIKATGFDLNPSIDEAIDKVIKSVERFVDENDTSAIIDIEVGKTTNHHKSGDIFRAEINLSSKYGNFRVEDEKSDVYAALSFAKDELIEALNSKKTKRIDIVRRSAHKLKNMMRGFYNK